MRCCLLLASLTLCLGASWAAAQEPPPADRLAALEAEVAALREALASLQSPTPAPPKTAPEPAPDLAELTRRIDLVAAELETLKLGEVAVQADRSLYGLGPAASKVYQQPKGVSIGGYGEMVYQNFAGTNDAGAPSAKTDEIDLLRGVVYVGYKWSDRWLLNTELEWEHSSTGKGGEASVEFAYVDRLIRPEFNVRAGLVLLPMGLLNELHEPTVFLGARRPGVENAILPTTWRENGVGVFGEIGGLTYRTYVVNGMDARGFTASGLRGGRQKGALAKAEDFAWVGRLDWSATPGLIVGGSAYRGGSGQGLVDPGRGDLRVGTRLTELHVDWRWRGFEARGLWSQARVDQVAGLNRALGLTGNRSVGEKLEGGYLQGGYDLLAGRGSDRLVAFVRFECFDTQAQVPLGWQRNPANDQEVRTFGLHWQPFDQLVVKGDWQDLSNDAGTAVDQFNLAFGWVF